MTPGKRLREARRAKKYTQEELGNLIGYTAETISRIENEKVPYNSAVEEKLYEAGINGVAITYGLEQKVDNKTIIFISNDSKPIILNGYLIEGQDYTIEEIEVLKNIQSCFKYSGINFEDIKKGNILCINHHTDIKENDIVVIMKKKQPQLYKLSVIDKDTFLLSNKKDKMLYNKDDNIEGLVGKVEYVINQLD